MTRSAEPAAYPDSPHPAEETTVSAPVIDVDSHPRTDTGTYAGTYIGAHPGTHAGAYTGT